MLLLFFLMPVMSKVDAILTNPYHTKCFDHTICLYNTKGEKSEPSLMVGDRMIARHDALGYYYPGKVTKIFECVCPLQCKCYMLHANVKFDDETRAKNLSSQVIIKFNESSSYMVVSSNRILISNKMYFLN